MRVAVAASPARRGPHAHAARDPLRGARARPPLARLGVGRVRRWRSEWSPWDWAGAVTLVVGVALGSAHSSATTRRAGGTRPASTRTASSSTGCGRWERSRSGSGSSRARRDRRARAPEGRAARPATRAFVVTSVAALAVFIGYAGIKGAYISTVFSTLVVERNVIYLCPSSSRPPRWRRARRRARLGDRGGDRVHALRRRVDAAPPRAVPVLRGARALDRRVREPRARVAGEPIENGLLVVCGLALAFVVALRFVRRGSGAYRVLAGTPRSSSSPGASRHRSTPPRASATSRRASHATCPPRTTGSRRRRAAARSSSWASRSPIRRASG